MRRRARSIAAAWLDLNALPHSAPALKKLCDKLPYPDTTRNQVAELDNPQGRFMMPSTWSSTTHDSFVEAVLRHDVEQVETSSRQIIRNAICFLREVHSHDSIAEEYQKGSYNNHFINTIYSLDHLPLDPDKVHILDSTVGIGCLIEQFKMFVQYCARRGKIEQGSEWGVAIGVLTCLAEFLRAEAVGLTSSEYRNLKAFVGGPLNASISRAVGDDILACSEYHHRCDGEQPFDELPCDLLLHHIACGFQVTIETISPRQEFKSRSPQLVIEVSISWL